jgi:hypothetical protein
VKRLIYTSSPSVVFDGVHGIFNADESMPYPDKVCLYAFHFDLSVACTCSIFSDMMFSYSSLMIHIQKRKRMQKSL